MTPLARMLRDAGHTQAALAEALHITQPTISRKLDGKSAWKVTELAQLAVLLDITPWEVMQAASDDMDGAA